ncbi:FMN reductase [Spirochaetia bacterium]|nr:FMN reductase [Spirochaetia bacterium]
MKVIAFNGSPHENGACGRGLKEVSTELAAEGIECEIVQVGGKLIHGCTACGSCHEKGCCAIKDDIVNESAQKAKQADGIILASPVYYGSIAGSFKCFLDRFFFSGGKHFGKVGAAIASVRRTGGIGTFHQLNNYLNLGSLTIAPTVYWNVIHGNNFDEAGQDAEGIYTLRTLGRNMAWLIKTLDAGKSVPRPEPLTPQWTNFIH